MHGKGIAYSTSRQDNVALASLHFATMHNYLFVTGCRREQDWPCRIPTTLATSARSKLVVVLQDCALDRLGPKAFDQ